MNWFTAQIFKWKTKLVNQFVQSKHGYQNICLLFWIQWKIWMEPNNFGFQNQVFNVFMQEYLATIHNWWYLNSGCSRHMTGDKTKFCLLTESDGGQVTFGENIKGKIINSRKVGKNLSSCIDDVMLVEGLWWARVWCH